MAVLRRIAADEARHAELAWRFVAWAITEGGAPVAQAVTEAAERAIAGVAAMEIRSYEGIDLEAFHSHGRLTCVEARAAAERAIREVVRPCLLSVLGGAAAGEDRAAAAG